MRGSEQWRVVAQISQTIDSEPEQARNRYRHNVYSIVTVVKRILAFVLSWSDTVVLVCLES